MTIPADSRRPWTIRLLGLCSAFVAAIASAAPPLVTPAKVELDQPEASLQLLVTTAAAMPNQQADQTRIAKYRSEDTTIATVDELGLVEPKKDGETAIVVELAGEQTRVPVSVRGISRPRPISFPRDIIPVLTKA